MYISNITIDNTDHSTKWLGHNPKITINIDTTTVKINTCDLQTIRPVCFIGDDGWKIVHQIMKYANTQILFDGEESKKLFIMDQAGRCATDIIRDYNNVHKDYPNNYVVMCCNDIDKYLTMDEQIELISKLEFQHNVVLILNVNSPYLIGDCFRKDVYLVNDEYNLTNPDDETFGSSFDYILQTIFGKKVLISKRSQDFMQEAVNSNNVEQIERCLRTIGESFEKRFLYQKLEELKEIPAK